MDSKENCPVLLSEVKNNNEDSVVNVIPSTSSCYSNLVSSDIPRKETGLNISMNPQPESQVETKISNLNESCQVVKNEDPSVSNPCLENRKECPESTIILRKDIGVTPTRDTSKSYVFQQGVTFSSTPLNGKEIKKGMMNVFDNLSIIKEEDESLLNDSKESAVLVKEPKDLLQTENKCIESVKEHNSPDLSVLKKDELSLIIDNANGSILMKEKIHVNNNLTLSVHNSESVVYKNIIDKTVDDLLIEGNEPKKIKELCNLETEDKKKEILDKAAGLKLFVSPNDEENKDNNDPEWELLRKLETDDDRYKAVRKLWRNLAIPDLKQNLSTFNWRKKNSLPPLKNITPLKTDQIGKKKKNLKYHCTEIFDVGIKKIEDFCQRQYQGTTLESDYDLSIMESLKKKPRLDGGFVSKWDYQTNYDRINDCFQERLLRHTEAKQEITAVHSFYNGLKNQGNGGYGNIMLISHEERQNILEIESMISNYNGFYNRI